MTADDVCFRVGFFVPLRSEKNFKPHPQTRYRLLVALSLSGYIQNFWSFHGGLSPLDTTTVEMTTSCTVNSL